eukprot:gene25178-30728_t
MLMVSMMKPPLTEDEVQWKKGVRMDNRAASRNDGHRKGVRFFKDDEDFYQLEDTLMALCFLEAGDSWVPVPPWKQFHYPFEVSRRATDLAALTDGARQQLERMLQGDDDDDYDSINGCNQREDDSELDNTDDDD